MLLTHIDAENLLSFQQLHLEIRPGLNVVVGQNDAGKSNIVRLVRLARDAIAGHPTSRMPFGQGVERRFVRIGSFRGRLSLGVHFAEERERALLTMFIRAVAAHAAVSQPTSQPRTSEEWANLHNRTAEFIRSSLGPNEVSPLMTGRVVMELDSRQPARWAVGFEFDSDCTTYHVGILGRGVMVNAVVRGTVDIDRSVSSVGQTAVASRLDLAAPRWEPVGLRDLLPQGEDAVAWNVGPSSTGELLPLTLELARELGLAADNTRPPDLGWVLREIVGRGIAVTSNLRRPPRTSYNLTEAREGLAVEDAGDLPLELYRRKMGSPAQRANFGALQERFHEMTGARIDLRSSYEEDPIPGGPYVTHSLVIEPQVESGAGWVPIDHAGAGMWEALVALSAALTENGQVLLFDEPATHLHSTWQRLFLRYLQDHHQAILITHSPFLVPSDSVEDLQRVVRLAPEAGGTVARGLGQAMTTPGAWHDRWRQLLAGSTDLRSVLFTRGVILVEGETELGAFRHWFNDPTIVHDEASGLDARNLMVLPVDGDWNFGPHISYLLAVGVPWVIVADGPALSPNYKHNLLTASGLALATGESVWMLTGQTPSDADDFLAWKTYWEANRVVTVATAFGLKTSGEKLSADSKESGEIERYFRRLAPEVWAKAKAASTSKVRRGYAFAEQLDLYAYPDALSDLQALWQQMLAQLGY